MLQKVDLRNDGPPEETSKFQHCQKTFVLQTVNLRNDGPPGETSKFRHCLKTFDSLEIL